MINGIPVVLGTAVFGTSLSQENSFRILDRYASLGGRIIDTSNNYAYWQPDGKGGESESVIGKWLKGQDRSAYTIMTKIGSLPIAGKEGQSTLEGLSSEAVYHAVNRSLVRLKTNYIDILLAHHDDMTTPLQDTWSAFSRLVATGKVRKIGVSNYSPKRVRELAAIVLQHSLAPIDCVQLKYSLIDPVAGADFGNLVLLNQEMKRTLRTVAAQAVIFGYSPLLGGGGFNKPSGGEWPSEYDSIENRKKVTEIQSEAKKLDVSPSAFVLRQIADQGIIPITATGRIDRLETNLRLMG